MTKADLVEEIHAKTGIEQVVIRTAIDEFIDTVKSSLEKGENVYLRGFGSFIIKKRARKVGRNISKGTTVIIPEHNIPFFKPSKEFVKLVKKN